VRAWSACIINNVSYAYCKMGNFCPYDLETGSYRVPFYHASLITYCRSFVVDTKSNGEGGHPVWLLFCIRFFHSTSFSRTIVCSMLFIQLMRVNSTNVLDEGLRIGEIGRRMNSKVKLVKIGICRKKTWVFNLACFQSGLHRPLLAPIYRWLGLEDRVGSDRDYNIDIR
jgi:hypothetical protein